MTVRGIRGAITVESNTRKDILSETHLLLKEMLKENSIKAHDIVSIFFSMTHDLDAVFPAAAAREMGLTQTPLLCLNEVDIPGGLKQCIRILMHVNSDVPQSEMSHIYLKQAVKLRPDISKTEFS